MIVDCESCPVRGVRCDGCIVTELLAAPALEESGAQMVIVPGAMGLDALEREALSVFVDSGLVSPREARTVRARREPWSSFRAVG